MTRVLIAGVSTRAAADSAARAGFDVIALDGYADRDQHPAVQAIALPREPTSGFTASRAVQAATAINVDAVAYLSNFENDPGAVAALATGRALWGNTPDTLQRVRDPVLVAHTFRTVGVPVPDVFKSPDDADASSDYLAKPLSSGGGHGIRRWEADRPLPAGFYLQEHIDGTPGSIVCVAAAGRATVLGVSRQLIGDQRFGVDGFRYCGNILAPVHDLQFEQGPAVFETAYRLASVAASAFGLVGVCGIDFIARAGAAYPVEINPRWSASMELVERSSGCNAFNAHAIACAQGSLPEESAPPGRAFGKAIVFARQSCAAGDTDAWLADADIRDVPHAGDAIAAGSPVCTVFAQADTAAACEDALVARADRIYADMRRWTFA